MKKKDSCIHSAALAIEEIDFAIQDAERIESKAKFQLGNNVKALHRAVEGLKIAKEEMEFILEYIRLNWVD